MKVVGYEIEVSDHYSSWGAGGKIFRPGIYRVSKAIADAAVDDKWVTVREIVEDTEPEPEIVAEPEVVIVAEPSLAAEAVEVFEPEPQPAGTLTRADMGGVTSGFPCPWTCGVPTFRGRRALDSHMRRAHQGQPPQAVEKQWRDPADVGLDSDWEGYRGR